ncbi:MAG: AMP-binding protein [Actinomycetes bacterium]
MSDVISALTDAGGPATPLGVHFDRLAEEAPDAPSVIFGSTTWTRRQLNEGANRLARHLADLGVQAGDLVTIGLPNGPDFYRAVIAAWKLGAVPQPVSHRLPAGELAALVEVADPKVVIGLDPGDGRPWLPVGFDAPTDLPAGPLPAVIAPSWKAPTSGGSTGRPKLIVATTPGVAEVLAGAAVLFRITGDVPLLCTGPLYHNGPFMVSMIALGLGAPVVLMARFDAAETLRLVETHRVGWLYLVPTMMVRILKLPEDERLAHDLSSVRTAYHLGAPCPPHVKQAWIDWLGPDVIVELYAGTEGQAVTVITGQEWLDHPGSVGRVVGGLMKVLDPDGREAPAGEVGEIFMRSTDGRATYRYVGAAANERDGWESLGDMGWFDHDDYLYLADRAADMVLVGGANVYPAEIEAALLEHPAVLSACVIGVPDDEYGNLLHALVEVGEPVSDDDLHAHLASRLVPYKQPRRFVRSDTPLRDDTGKMRRTAIRQAYLETTDS